MVSALQHVLFAGPHQLDWRARHLLGDVHRLGDIVAAAAPPKAATQVDLVDIALVLRQAGRRGARGQRGFAVLRRAPDFALVCGPQGGGVHRLHRRVVLERVAVDRFEFFRCTGDGSIRIAHLVADEHVVSRVEPGLVALGNRRTADCHVRAVVPRHRQRIQRHLGAPERIGHHGNRAVTHLVDTLDAGHARDLGRIEADQLAAEHRTGLDGRDDHAGQFQIGAVDARAVDFFFGVETGDALADQLPVLAVFQLDVFRHFHLARCG